MLAMLSPAVDFERGLVVLFSGMDLIFLSSLALELLSISLFGVDWDLESVPVLSRGVDRDLVDRALLSS